MSRALLPVRIIVPWMMKFFPGDKFPGVGAGFAGRFFLGRFFPDIAFKFQTDLNYNWSLISAIKILRMVLFTDIKTLSIILKRNCVIIVSSEEYSVLSSLFYLK